MLVSWILAVAIVILAVFFASNNLTLIDVDFFGRPVHETIGVLMVYQRWGPAYYWVFC